MRHDALLAYANEEHPDFERYNLSLVPPVEPAKDETVRARRGKKKHRRKHCNRVETAPAPPPLDETKTYMLTKPTDWKRVKKGRGGRKIDPIEYTGASEFFKVNITDEELELLKDENAVIWYYKVLEWTLPRFERELQEFCEWIALRI